MHLYLEIWTAQGCRHLRSLVLLLEWIVSVNGFCRGSFSPSSEMISGLPTLPDTESQAMMRQHFPHLLIAVAEADATPMNDPNLVCFYLQPQQVLGTQMGSVLHDTLCVSNVDPFWGSDASNIYGITTMMVVYGWMPIFQMATPRLG